MTRLYDLEISVCGQDPRFVEAFRVFSRLKVGNFRDDTKTARDTTM